MGAPIRHDWFLEAWMDHFHLNQDSLRAKTGWSKRKASDLCTGEQRYNRDSLNEAAFAMNIAPYELLLHPDDAYEIKNLRAAVRQEALKLVADNRVDWTGPEEAFRRDGTTD